MQQKKLAEEIFNRYGTVTRCRQCFIYTKKTVRLTDLYQENGRAILGWDAGNAFTFFKNNLNRGVTGFFIAEEKSSVEKAVSSLLNSDRKIFYFAKKEDALKAALSISQESTSIWIPWSPAKIDYSTTDAIILLPPLPWTNSVFILAVKSSQDNETSLDTVPNSIKLPYPLESAIARAVYNMIAEEPKREEKDWFLYDTILTKYWTRKGPYLYPKIPKELYDKFVLHCLDCKLVINPDYNSPSIIPFGADKGVFNSLKNNPFIFE